MSILSDEARPALRWVGIALMVVGGAVAGYVARAAQEPTPLKNESVRIDPSSIPVLPVPGCVYEKDSR